MKNIKLLYSTHKKAALAHEISYQRIPYCELTVVLKGHLDYSVDGVRTPLGQGDAIYIRAGSIRTRPPAYELCDYVSFNFETQNEINLPVHIKNAVGNEEFLIISAFDKISGHYYSDNNEAITHLLGCMLSLLEDRVKIGNFSPLTQSIISYINKNLASKISLTAISEITHFSPIYCDTVFKREVGQPIIDFLIDKRIEQSKNLLMDQTIPLRTVSELTGFNDYNYFSRIFKKRIGVSPSTYRKIMIK